MPRRTIPEKTIDNVQIPSNIQQASFSNANWIVMTPREITSQTTITRGLPLLGKKGTVFKFLAPEEITDTQNHEWDVYESVQKRIAEKVREFAKIGEEGSSVIKAAINTGKEAINPERSASRWYNSLGRIAGTEVIRAKVDTPLVYANSERRNFTLTFNLLNVSITDDIVRTVKLLQQYAAPESPGVGSISFQPPFIFSVASTPDQRIVNLKYAALRSVQSTYRPPYIQGTPMHVELTLEFQDIEPLFANAIRYTSKVNVVTTTG